VFASIFEKNTSMVSKGNNSLNLFFPKRPEGPALIKAKIDWGCQFYREAQDKKHPARGKSISL
jgi:hypothetical protein